MKRNLILLIAFFGCLSLAFWYCGTEGSQGSPKEVAEAYVKAARNGDVDTLQSLSTEDYKDNAEREVYRFKDFTSIKLVKSEVEEESEGTWHIFYYEGGTEEGKTKKVAVAVLEKDGKNLVGDVD